MQLDRTNCSFGNVLMPLPPAWVQLWLPWGPALPTTQIHLGRFRSKFVHHEPSSVSSISAGKGAGDHQILPVPGEARRLRAQSHATIVHNSRSSRPHCIASVNYVLT